jgi:hypothetical protein
MDYQALNSPELQTLLLPENDLEAQILSIEDVLQGMQWGFPRFGHPEGKVMFHVRDIYDNIDTLNLDLEIRRKLRLIALVHDTFKFKENRKEVAKDSTKHHAYLAYDFLSKFTEDQDVLQVVKTHDDAYYAWRCAYAYRDPESAKIKLDKLLKANRDHLELYYAFFVCDTRTGDKNQSPIRWFEEKLDIKNRIKI